MVPAAQTCDTARTVGLPALNSHMNGTDTDTTIVRITTAVANRIDLRWCNDGFLPGFRRFAASQYRTLRGLHNSAPSLRNPLRDRPAGIAIPDRPAYPG